MEQILLAFIEAIVALQHSDNMTNEFKMCRVCFSENKGKEF